VSVVQDPLAVQALLAHRARSGVRLGPAGEGACRPPASRGEGAEGTACVPSMRLPVFLGLLGGIAASGAIGIVLGPVIVALTLALLRFAEEESGAGAQRT